jgi:hypothetical protein
MDRRVMRALSRTVLLAFASLGLAACASVPLETTLAPDRTQIEARLMADIRTLSSDEFGGRKPGTDGERMTTDFIITELQAAGWQSGTNDPGSEWLAPVPLFATQPATSRIAFGDARASANFEADGADAVAFTSRRRVLIEAGEVVYVGKLGEEVPEEAVAGKIVLMLGEPGVSPARRAALFAKGPAAVLTVIETQEEITNVRRTFGRERIELLSEEAPQVLGYVTQSAMGQALGEEQWAQLVASADEQGFAARKLSATATIEATSDRRLLNSNNVIGRLPGTQPGSGTVLMLGHWDHLGECGPPEAEDRLCNGAVDNASGIAVMLELARRLASVGPLERDIYFLATSAEESGLLGARAFIRDPAIALDRIVAAFNFDTVAIAPAGSRVGFIGEADTQLAAVVREEVAKAGREMGDAEYANSFLRRQDGWALLQEGVPAVMISSAFSSQDVLAPFLTTNYHRASDEIEAIELGGAIDDLLLHESLIKRVGTTALYPATGQ